MARFLTLLLFGYFLGFLPDTAQAQSVEHLLQRAVNNSAEVAKAKAAIEVADADLSIAKSSWFPQISARLYNGIGDTKQSNPLLQQARTSDDIQNNSISLQQSIYNKPGWIQIERARLGVREAELRHSQAVQNVIQQWVQKLMECKQAELAIQMARQRLKSAELLRDQTNYATERGEASPLEVLSTITEHSLRKAEMDEATSRLTQQLRVLSKMTDQTIEAVWLENIEFQLPNNIIDLANSEQEILEKNSDLLIQRTYIESAELGINQARSQHHPTVALLAQNSQSKSETVSTLGNRVNQNVLALQVNVPLFNGFGTLAGTEKAIATLSQQKAELDRVKTETINRLHEATQQLEASRSLAGAYNQAIQSIDLQEKAIETAISHKLATPLDLAQLQEKRIDLQQRKLDRVMKTYQAHMAVQALCGQLTVQAVSQQMTAKP